MTTRTVTVTRMLPASPAEVFDVWLDPASPASFFHGPGRAVVSAVAVDGLFYHRMKIDDRSWHHYGRFVRVERPRLVEHTWVSQATHGLESVVTTSFVARGDDTLMTIVHSGLPDDEDGRSHEAGWNHSLDGLDRFFSEKTNES